MNHETTPLSAHCGETDCAEPIVARGVCRVHYLQAWRAKTLDELPTTSRERVVCPADHPHDLATCYELHNCRCDGCRRLRRIDRRLRRAELSALGRVDEIRGGRAPAEPVREHLTKLMMHAGLDRIADAAGVRRSTVGNLYYGPRGSSKRNAGTPPQTVHTTIAEQLLAVTPEQIDAAFRDSTGTVRRLRALVATGHSQTVLAQHLGVDRGNLSGLIHGKRPRVSAKTYAATCELFSELWAHPVQGSAGERSRTLAKAHGWVGPLAWDDIDDPAEVANVRGPKKKRIKEPVDPDNPEVLNAPRVKEPVIDEIAVELAIKGERVKLTSDERCEAVTRLHRERWSDKRIAAALHVTDRTVLRIRQRLGLEAFDFSEIRQVESA